MATSRDRPGIIAPPPVLTVLAIGAGLAADHFLRLPLMAGGLKSLRIAVTALLAMVAAALLVAAKREFHKHRTTANPYRPSTAVVTTGIYRLTRNPIYVAMMLVVAAVGVGANTLWLLAALVPLGLLLHFGVVKREERYLAAKFGGAYEQYLSGTRRWL